MLRFLFLMMTALLMADRCWAFVPSGLEKSRLAPAKEAVPIHTTTTTGGTRLFMAQITEKEAQAGIDKVVAALRKDKQANEELGRLQSVNNVLGFGSPTPGQVAVRFNASFKRGGMGRAAVPLPFGLGQTNKSEGRGVMVGQVKASVDSNTGKVTSCSVFRDLGYGRAFNLKV
ncbi:expressed unknown protein [Seminavis robusta]|uniref:Uncharacterized protein n=1 Tax=Seminavis robusta TaxID=568900 RepID=A0A9N8H717_9STRA|nr:expressed unknown protein [Seminavis robusta]|eukprot:Sro189_g081360.1 n/a (173) ;mRNA; f:869-1387